MISRRLLAIAGTLVLGASMLSAAVAGKYKVEMERPAGMQGGGGGGGRMMNTSMELQEADGKLTGKVTMGAGERSRTVDIENGKVEGGKFSFETTFSTPNGDFVMVWEGTVEGETLKGTRAMKGGERPPQNFTATKAE